MAGVTTIDTAPSYGDSEVRIGEYLKKNKNTVLRISTKVGIPTVYNLNSHALYPSIMNSSINLSLVRLGVETIDGTAQTLVDS